MTPAKTCPRCEDFANDARKVLSERYAPDEQHCSCVPHLRAEIERLAVRGDQHATLADGLRAQVATLIAQLDALTQQGVAVQERPNRENAALGAEVRRLGDDLKHVSTVLGEHLRPGQTPASAIARLIGDLEACERERDAYRSSAELAADRANRAQAERDELRLALLAEQGDASGAPEGWVRISGSWWCRPGPLGHQAEVCRANIHPDGEPYHWTLHTPTLSAEGYAPTAREAMLAADRAWQEKA